MQSRRLGRTDIELSAIGHGCIQFSQGQGFVGKAYAPIAQETMNAVVAAALKGGIDWFDTAEKYGNGKSEEALATALRHAGVPCGNVRIATKWYPVLRTAGHLRRSFETRLRCLQGYPIDLYQIHLPFSGLSSIVAQLREMAELRQTRRIGAIGVSNYSAKQMTLAAEALRSRGAELASNQVRINLLDRKIETNGVLAAARKLGVTLIAHSPLAGGILTGKFHERPELIKSMPALRRLAGGYNAGRLERTARLVAELRDIGRAYGVSAAQIALNWLIAYYGDTVVAIPGASRPEQAASNAAVMAFRLTPRELERLDELSKGFSK